ncbi:MAG: 30S ribosomal protein S19 [Nanoarchaeota archaeon]|nr:30S ribosomal protein S19 [Nanoarchaeota archaeon]|tara:strand:+ start:1751 stop:2140 length:390 start_codon:yes stop_codon:yes gene_type:complete
MISKKKEMTFWGKSEEELKQLDLKELLPLLPSRIRRSLTRGISDEQKKVMAKVANGESNIKTHCRNLIILPSMIGTLFRIHNGKDWMPVTIVAEMTGHRLGEFAPTRKSVSHSSAGVGATRSSKAVSAR